MRRIIGTVMLLTLLAVATAGCGSRQQTAPAQVQAPSASVPSAPAGTKAPELPGDTAALQAALGESPTVKYQIVLADDLGGKDKDAYLDALLTDKHWPEPSMLVVVIYVKENYDARIAMGANFSAKKVSIDELLTMMRTAYFPKARVNDPAGGLADLIRAMNQRMAQ